MNLPNLLTISRIVAIPAIIWLVFIDHYIARQVAFILYVVACLTDYLDGYLARKMNIVSDLGRMLDPIADKLLVGTLLIAFAYTGEFDQQQTWLAIAIMFREIAVAGLREYLGNAQITVHVSKLAKYKTTVQLVALATFMVVPLVPNVESAANGLMWLAALLTVYTGYEYFAGAWPKLTDKTVIK
jgi:CDP-diacylglycerol--glycerol-3-phosphate 3-phosphatidyltransferase